MTDQYEEAWAKIHDLLAAGHWSRAREIFDQSVSATPSAWIPVNERLPSPHTDDDFIVATLSGYVTALNFGEHGWYSGFSSDDEEKAKDGYWNGCVTHWRAMPAAPAENKATTL